MGTRIGIERTRGSARWVISRRIEAPIDRVWRLFTDTHAWPAWGTSVTAVSCTDRFVATGTTGRIRLVGGLWLPFTVTSCRSHRWRWRIGPVPATGHRVESDGDGCTASFEVPLLWLAYLPVCHTALSALDELARRDP